MTALQFSKLIKSLTGSVCWLLPLFYYERKCQMLRALIRLLSEAFEQFGSGFSPLKEPAHMGCSIHNPTSHFWFHGSCKPNPPRPAPSTARFQAVRPNLRCLGLKLLEKVLSDTEALDLIVIWMLSHNNQQPPAHTASSSSRPAEAVRRDQSLQCPRAKYCG